MSWIIEPIKQNQTRWNSWSNPIQCCLFRFLSVLTFKHKNLTNEFVSFKFDWARLSSVRFCSIVYHSAIQNLNFSMADYQGNRYNKSYHDCSQSLGIYVGEFSQSIISEKMPFTSESLTSKEQHNDLAHCNHGEEHITLSPLEHSTLPTEIELFLMQEKINRGNHVYLGWCDHG